ncbi:putative ferric-chelate reductase 1 [Mugil cephalus]|uniref:putative ferric-chelate reductase 1 n=1 Tax=Mugil cephalus TaxID=48193 RepID=UPI001FB822B0|nr:putative ferric-chelate reductase 1 [Mugil cephalus]
MQRGLILLFATVMVFVAMGVQGTSKRDNTKVSITRDYCGATKVCVETPDNCDPANTTCLFTSIHASDPKNSSTDLFIELSGSSQGYIAMGLTENATEGTTLLYVCARNTSNGGNNKFFFRTMERNNMNNSLSEAERSVTEIRGTVDESFIECMFNVSSVNATSIRNFTVLLGWGTVDGDGIKSFNVSRTEGPLSFDVLTGTTAAPTTTTTESRASYALQSHAVLLLLSVLTLTVLKTD